MERIAGSNPDPDWEFAAKMCGQQQRCKQRFIRKLGKKNGEKGDDCVLEHAVTN